MSLAALEMAPIADPFANAAREIGFVMPERYNASALLFDNLERAEPRALIALLSGPLEHGSYAELCTAASRYGHALLACGLQRGDRVLLFLDDGPTYPASLFGAIRAGLVPVLVNTLTPNDLLNFYLQDSGAPHRHR